MADGAAAGTVVGEVAASDPESSRISYSLVSGAGFAVNASTGSISVTAVPNRATALSVSLVVTASDGANTVQASFLVLVIRDSSMVNGVQREHLVRRQRRFRQ